MKLCTATWIAVAAARFQLAWYHAPLSESPDKGKRGMGVQIARGVLIVIIWVALPFAAFRPWWMRSPMIEIQVELILAGIVTAMCGVALWLIDRYTTAKTQS